jgi:hypothetical protein
MGARLFILAGFLAACLAGPAAADGVRWIDPWAPEELAGGAGPHWIDPWAEEDCGCAPGNADLTGSVELAGFTGGVGNRQTIVVIQNGFTFHRPLPAGQAAMTGARAAPVHPLGRPRF